MQLRVLLNQCMDEIDSFSFIFSRRNIVRDDIKSS